MAHEPIDLVGIKRIELDILKEFDSFCRKNNLHYSLGEGTLIGAVRHRGFIPWDDDVDVLMPRRDFDLFLEKYKGDSYKIIRPEKNSVFPFFFCRLTDVRTVICFTDNNRYPESTYYEGGIFIDILPIDFFPNTVDEIRRHEKRLFPYFKLYRLMKRRGYYLKGASPFRNIVSIITKGIAILIPEKLLRAKIYKLLVRYNNETTDWCGFWTNYWHHPWVFPAHVFESYIELEFEGSTFLAMSGYDEYLRCEYGDYMVFPPKEKQIAAHCFNAYWK